MLSQSNRKLLRQLSQKKYRDSLGLFIVEGEKMVSEAIASGLEVLFQVSSEDDGGEEVLRTFTQLSTPPPVLAVVRKREEGALTVPPLRGTFLALDSIRDPGNLGTIIRIADWFGIDGIYASADTVDQYNPKVVQSTMGSLFRVPILKTDLAGLCRSVASANGCVLGTFLDGRDLYRSGLGSESEAARLVVIGNESRGISPEVGKYVTGRILIPSYPPMREEGAESLNAAVATAVVLSEIRRRDSLPTGV